MKGTAPDLDGHRNLESEGDRFIASPSPGCSPVSSKPSATLYWKDIIESLENALDAIEDASDVIEGIVLKHA